MICQLKAHSKIASVEMYLYLSEERLNHNDAILLCRHPIRSVMFYVT